MLDIVAVVFWWVCPSGAWVSTL